MEVLAIKLVEQILEELSRDEAIVVSISGPLKDSATVALPTFLGGLTLGPIGAILGAATGTGILSFSKLLGFGHYKPLVTALREDFTEQERNALYERLWTKLQDFVTSPLNQSLAYSAIVKLSKAIESDPETMENLKNELKKTLGKKYMTLN